MKINSFIDLPDVFLGPKKDDILEGILGRRAALPHPQRWPQIPTGQFSLCVQDDAAVHLIRDRLGINKLFYHFVAPSPSSASQLTIANSIQKLVRAGVEVGEIFSVPPGHVLSITKTTGHADLKCYYDMSAVLIETTFDRERFQREVSIELERTFDQLGRTFPNALFVVCLSGGLDSTLLATYACDRLKRVLAATFSYVSDTGKKSEDFEAARSIATTLGLDFFPVLRSREIQAPALEQVMKDCQDWRDFNVHCAWVNHYLAEALRVAYPTEEIVFITGDLMNEYVADYAPAIYEGVEYYPQPKISRGRLRRFFVYGLDTSDREVGVFARYQITTIQPYAQVAENYLRIPDNVVDQAGSKEFLNLPLIRNPDVSEQIVKTKVRAQVGGKDGGTLGLFHQQGISQKALKEKWDLIFGAFPIIQSGRYRSQ